jgi:hypothetical protein
VVQEIRAIKAAIHKKTLQRYTVPILTDFGYDIIDVEFFTPKKAETPNY